MKHYEPSTEWIESKFRHIIAITSENQRQRENMKSNEEKRHIVFECYAIGLAVDFYTDTTEARRQRNE